MIVEQLEREPANTAYAQGGIENFLFGADMDREVIAGFRAQRGALARVGRGDRRIEPLLEHPVLVRQQLNRVHGGPI